MNSLFKLSIFITSFLPLWLSVLFIDVLNIVRHEQSLCTEYISIAILIIINLSSILIIKMSMKNLKDIDYTNYKIKEAYLEKGITSEYLLSYILPLFAFDFTKWDSVVQFLIYFSILSFLCIRNNNVYANLIFEFGRYRFYSCELVWASELKSGSITGIVISKDNLTAKKGHIINIAVLNKPFFLMKS